MKIAVTALESGLEAKIDPRFGRAHWIAIVDPETGSAEFLDNTAGMEATGGAGVQTANLVLGTGAEILVTGHVGPKAAQALSNRIKIVEESTGTVAAAVERIRKGDL